jgi:uncharacterized phosphosugar-binding protein
VTTSFLSRLREILDVVASTQDGALDAAAERMAGSLEAGGLVHLFGSGHSVIPTLEIFPRYGSYVGFNPLTDPRLMWFNVLGPGGVRELLWLERTEGYVANFLESQPIGRGDTVIVFSHSGLNAAPIEAAAFARHRGAAVIAVTSHAGVKLPPSHSLGKRLSDLADTVIDTRAPAEDAVVDIDGWPSPVGGVSTIVACAIAQELVVRTARRLAAAGHHLPTFVAPTGAGASSGHNAEVFAAHRERLLRAAARLDSGDGGR